MGEDGIGNVTTIFLNSTDQLGNSYKTNISKGFTVNPEGTVTFAEVDTACRALCNLSNNIYGDTILVTNVSVNEAMQG